MDATSSRFRLRYSGGTTVLIRMQRSAQYTVGIGPSSQSASLPVARNFYICDMTTAEDIEKAVKQLAPPELARFASGSNPSTRHNSTLPLSETPAPASLTPSRMMHLPRTAPGFPATCEAFRFTQILDRLPRSATSGAKAGRCQLRTSKKAISVIHRCNSRKSDVTGPSIGLRYRALALDVDGGYLWFWIGSHAEYDKLIG